MMALPAWKCGKRRLTQIEIGKDVGPERALELLRGDLGETVLGMLFGGI